MTPRPDSLTRRHVLAAFTLLERAGLTRPAILGGGPGADDAAILAALDAGADVWVAVLADVTPDAFTAAILGHLREPNPPGQWTKPWPDTGRILALVPARRLAAVDDSAAAWAEVQTWCRTRGRCTETNLWRNPRPGELDDDDARDAAMRAGLDAIGGTSGWASRPTAEAHWTARTFAEAYRAARTSERTSAEVRLVTGPEIRTAIGAAPKPHASGFRRIGG